jgi:hypothetical protein
MGGWGIIVADIIVMANLAQIGQDQYFLLGAEIVTLIVFSAVALGRVVFGDVEGSVTPA